MASAEVIGLPPALGDWAEDLDLFPRDVALSILPWLPQLAASIGPLHARPNAGDGDPDGFVGIQRRGPYDRLLLSEWLLAELAPLEFVRRAAMSEHNFLELARVAPQGSRRSVVLLDAGPHQIGAPRIAHLAALIVLARRAREAGAEFAWGVLQADDPTSHSTVDEHSIRNLLTARSNVEATPEMVEAWRVLLGFEDADRDDDIWAVGGQRTSTLLPSASRFVVDDIIEPDVRRLAVTVLRRRDVERNVELELPEPRAATRLLRNPFEVPTKVVSGRASTSVRPSLLFSHTGRRVFVREPGGVRMYGVPQGERQHWADTHYLGGPDLLVLAAGTHRRQFYLLVVDGDTLHLRGYARRGNQILSIPITIDGDTPICNPGRDTPLGLLIPRGRSCPPPRFLWHDHTGRLFVIDTGARCVTQIDDDVAAIARQNGHVYVVTPAADHATYRIFEVDLPDGPIMRRQFKVPGEVDAVFLVADDTRMVVVHRDNRLWNPVPHNDRLRLELDGSEEVIGIARVQKQHRDWAAVTISSDRHALHLRAQNDELATLWEGLSVIRGAACQSPFVAMTTSDDQLVIIHTETRAVLRTESLLRYVQ